MKKVELLNKLQLNMNNNVTNYDYMKRLPLDTVRYTCAEILTSKETKRKYPGLLVYIVDVNGQFAVMGLEDGEIYTSAEVDISYDKVHELTHDTDKNGNEYPFLLFVQDNDTDSYSALSADNLDNILLGEEDNYVNHETTTR